VFVQGFPVTVVLVLVEELSRLLEDFVLLLELESPFVESQTRLAFGLSHPATLHPAVAGGVEAGTARKGRPSPPRDGWPEPSN
jgi:hypothetical protein